MEYVGIALGAALGAQLLICGLWYLGYNVLPADGRVYLVQRPARLAGMVAILIALLVTYLGIRFSDSGVQTIFFFAFGFLVLVLGAGAIKDAKLVIFNLYPRDRGKGRPMLALGILLLALNAINLAMRIAP